MPGSELAGVLCSATLRPRTAVALAAGCAWPTPAHAQKNSRPLQSCY